jgi:HK97 family phage portal protein
MEWQSLSMPLADAQFIEQAQFSRTEVALLFRVPPYMLAAESGSPLTYSTTEGHSQDFVKWSLRRWLKRIEGTLTRDPDIFLQGARFYPEFLVDALLRGDSKTRSEVYARALDPVKGWLDVDEVREMENRNPLTEAQREARKELAKVAKPAPKPETETGDDEEETT